MLGLGHVYRRGHARKALRAVFRHNWRADLTDHPALFRLYALNDEAGLLVASWPRGGRPGYPVIYADEVFCGIEYQVASHLIYEGLVDEGLAIVKGVRDRHTGERRNPWNEFECGHHYARSMASYALLLALSGFSYSGPEARVGFAPRVSERTFQTFFSVAGGWGTYGQRIRGAAAELSLQLESGQLTIASFETSIPMSGDRTAAVRVGNKKIAAALRKARGGAILELESPVTLAAGQTLRIRIQ
jgi:hypothetical protein